MAGFAIILTCLLLLNGAPAAAQPHEDEAHRLDHIETQRLNEAAARRLAASSEPAAARVPTGTPPRRAPTPAEQALHAREEQALDAWRRAAEECRARRRRRC